MGSILNPFYFQNAMQKPIIDSKLWPHIRSAFEILWVSLLLDLGVLSYRSEYDGGHMAEKMFNKTDGFCKETCLVFYFKAKS